MSETEWLWNFLANLPISAHLPTVVPIYCDCQTTIGRDRSKMYNGKNKHICTRYSIVKQLLEFNVVNPDFVRSKSNLVDPFDKIAKEEFNRDYVERDGTTVYIRKQE